jgi:hypothetical protein
MARDIAAFSTVIVRLGRTIQYSRDVSHEIDSRGVLDPPHARGMTAAIGRSRSNPSSIPARDGLLRLRWQCPRQEQPSSVVDDKLLTVAATIAGPQRRGDRAALGSIAASP